MKKNNNPASNTILYKVYVKAECLLELQLNLI